MGRLHVRPAELKDLPGIVDIYNHYVLNTAVTFDVEPYTAETRLPWFDQFSATGRHRLLVASEDERITGYAGTLRYRPKAAYETSVEVTCYCAPNAVGSGIGSALYGALFEAIAG